METPRLSSQRLSPPAPTARVTSLIVVSQAFLIALKSSSGKLVQVKRRWVPVLVLNGTFGAGW